MILKIIKGKGRRRYYEIESSLLQVCLISRSLLLEWTELVRFVRKPCIRPLVSRWQWSRCGVSWVINLSGFDKRYLQKFLATASFEACSVLDHSFFFFFNDLFSTKIPLKAIVAKFSGRHHCALWRNKSHDWQSLPSSNMLPYFVSFWLNGWNTDLGLETERHHIASFDVGGDESLASEVLCRSQIYSARAKLMLISDQARDLVKICFEAGVHVSLSKRLVYIRDLE